MLSESTVNTFHRFWLTRKLLSKLVHLFNNEFCGQTLDDVISARTNALILETKVQSALLDQPKVNRVTPSDDVSDFLLTSIDIKSSKEVFILSWQSEDQFYQLSFVFKEFLQWFASVERVLRDADWGILWPDWLLQESTKDLALGVVKAH